MKRGLIAMPRTHTGYRKRRRHAHRVDASFRPCFLSYCATPRVRVRARRRGVGPEEAWYRVSIYPYRAHTAEANRSVTALGDDATCYGPVNPILLISSRRTGWV